MIQSARNGGSLTPAMLTRLRRLERDGKLTFYEHCEVSHAEWKDDGWRVTCSYADAHNCIAHLPIDRLWLATGSQLDIRQWSLLSEIRATYPFAVVDGLPVLDRHLRPGNDLFIMGGAAALQLGPIARNLSGARMASDRIVSALIKDTIGRSLPAG